MIGELGEVQVWVATAPVDMRKSFDALAEVVRDGALGRLNFTGLGVDGRRGSGVLRWECAAVSKQ